MLATIRTQLATYAPPCNPHPVKRASVLIPLFEQGTVPHLLLTRRASHLRSHSGQVSFPGGKQDPEDGSAQATALRESEEEVGLLPQQVEIIGQIDQITSLHQYLVTPFVGVIPSSFVPRPNPEEIESVFSVPLDFFMNPEHHTSQEITHRDVPFYSHHFHFGPYDIWGMTAMLILRFLEVSLQYIPSYPVHHPGAPSWFEMTQRLTPHL